MSRPMSSPPPKRGSYRLPTVIAIVSGVGLLFALLGDDVWDLMSWLAVGLPVGIVAQIWAKNSPLFRRSR